MGSRVLARIHWAAFHREPMKPCRRHCGCDCDGLRMPCEHRQFLRSRYVPGGCGHCGYKAAPTTGDGGNR